MNNDSRKDLVYIGVGLILLYAVSKFFKGIGAVTAVVGNASDNIGLTTPEKAKDVKLMDAFKPNYYKTLRGKNSVIFTYASAKKLAKQIYDAKFSFIYTDDVKILSVIKQCKNKAQISFLTDVFYKEYEKDLITFFYTDMENKYLVDLNNYVSSLPN